MADIYINSYIPTDFPFKGSPDKFKPEPDAKEKEG